MRKHILLGTGRFVNKNNMYNTTTKSLPNRKHYSGRVETVKNAKYQNKVFKPLKFKNLSI